MECVYGLIGENNMGLTEIRKEINLIDDNMKKSFDNRLNCSLEVAKVKMQDNDDIYKPAREIEICERFSGEESYLLFIKKVMQISRKFQYKTFIDNNKIHEDFEKYMNEHYSSVFSKGGILDINLEADPNSLEGLNTHDILSVIADTKLSILKLDMDGTSNRLKVSLDVPDDEEAKKEAKILTYMLYKETIRR